MGETSMPTLMFGAAPEAETPAAPTEAEVAAQVAKDPGLQADNLSPEELKMVDDFVKVIDIKNSQAIMQYGADAQADISKFSEATLQKVRTKDLGEVGSMLSGLVSELKSFDVSEEEKGLKGLFKKQANKTMSMKAKYDKVEANINKVVEGLEAHQQTLMKDIATMDILYDENLQYFKKLSMYILAGKKKLAEVRANELQQAIDKANKSNLPEDVQAAKDLEDMLDRFEKKIYDLELSRTICLQTAPQIRLLQNNDMVMSEKIQSTIVNTIPLWKSQMVLALGIQHSNEAAKAQREVTDMTNELLKKNADVLKQATITTAQEAERGIVDIETLQHTNEQLISTFDEVMQIQEDGRQKRAAAELEMQRIEAELKQKMMENAKR